MRSNLFKPLFWLSIIVCAVIAVFVMLLSPAIGILLLLLFALAYVLCILLIPSLWPAVCPASKKKAKADAAVSNPNASALPKMMLESCSPEIDNITLDRPMFVIGHAADSDYVFKSSQGISSHHCRITYRETTQQFFLEDLGSTYGTFLNGRRLNKNNPVILRKDSYIALHTHRFRFKQIG